MLEHRIEQHFIDSADLKYQAAQVLSKPIAAAISAVLASVTSGGKVLACGNGGSAADAQHFARRAGFGLTPADAASLQAQMTTCLTKHANTNQAATVTLGANNTPSPSIRRPMQPAIFL